MEITSDDQLPAPGYLYDEVKKITRESFEYCEHMMEFLFSRLKKKSLNVKLKTLLVLRNILDNGNNIDFAKCLRKQLKEVKFYTTFSGPPAPLGDPLYESIRKTASDVIMLFDTDQGMYRAAYSQTSVWSTIPHHYTEDEEFQLEFPTIKQSLVCITLFSTNPPTLSHIIFIGPTDSRSTFWSLAVQIDRITF